MILGKVHVKKFLYGLMVYIFTCNYTSSAIQLKRIDAIFHILNLFECDRILRHKN